MKHYWLSGAVALVLASSGAYATMAPSSAPADPAPAAGSSVASPSPATSSGTSTPHHGHRMTLDEARKKAHERADKLDKMTEEEYAAQQEKRHEHWEKWKSMTPEQKAAWKAKKHAKHQAQQDGVTSAPATAPASTSMAAPSPSAPVSAPSASMAAPTAPSLPTPPAGQ